MDAHQRGAGPDDDRAGLSAFLWRPGAEEERSVDHDAELRDDGSDLGPMGVVRLQSRVWIGVELHRESPASVPARSNPAAGGGLFRDHSPPDLHDLPADV